MSNIIDSFVSIMLCAAGVFFAAHSLPSERKAAVKCAVALLIACVAYNAAWFPPYPHLIFGIRSTTYFSFISVLAGAYSFEKSLHHWWGLPLLMLYSLDICCHIVRAFNEVAYYPYSVAVDTLGYLQIAIFIFIGGSGVRNRVLNIINNVRDGINSYKAT